MPAQLYTFVEEQKTREDILNEMNSMYQNTQPAYMNISYNKTVFMPTFDVIDNISKLPRMRITFNTIFKGDHYLIDDIALFLINNPTNVFFIEDKSNEDSQYKYRIGVQDNQEPEKIATLQTLNKYGETFTYVMDVETSSRSAIEGDIVGTYQNVSLSALPYEFNVYNSMKEIDEMLGFENNRVVNGPNNLYRVTGYSSCFTCPSEMIRTDKNTSGSCLIGRITKTQEAQLQFGKITVPCKIVWFKTGFGEIPFPVCFTYDDYNDYQVDKYVMMFAYVKADFGDLSKKTK